MKKNTTINACLTQTGIVPRTTTEAVCSFNQKEKIMKNLRNFLVGLVSLLFVVQLTFVSPVAAQSSKQLERERLSRVMDANANVEEFRQEYINYLTEMADALRLFNEIPAVRRKFNQAGLQPVASLEQGKNLVAVMKPEDLIIMRAAYAKVSGWRDAPQAINSLLKPQLREQLELKLAAKKNSGGNITPDAIITDVCPDPSIVPSNSDIAVAKAAEIAADLVMELLPTDVITIVFREAASIARAAVKSGVLAAETLKAIDDDCSGLKSSDVQDIVNNAKSEIINNDNSNRTAIVNNDNSNKDTILNTLNTKTSTITTAITNSQNAVINNGDTNLATITTAITNAKTDIVNNDNSNRTTIVNNDNANATTLNTAVTNARNTIVNNDNTNTTNIVNNDNANKTAIINNATANTTTLNTAITNAKTEILNNANANATALQDVLLRSQIEADLAAESNGVKVAWYMTPTANGGKLDLVQSIVTLTLANITAAGGSIGNAQSFLDSANVDKAAGRFKSAYDNYRKAYKAAAN
ncbi:MAG: hypothetical protein H0X72_05640 [Acidobacteria bacterium]|jgi:hypothetical protein|nr:hypothetical protein [Acidobacteriota bacterium]